MSSLKPIPAGQPRIEYCVFDMDGTLLDTEKIYAKITNQIMARFGLHMTWLTKSKMMGKPALEAAKILFSSFPAGSIPADYTCEMYIEERLELLESSFRAVKPLPGAVDLLESLIEAEIPIALATGSTMEAVETKTSHLEIFKNFGPHVQTANSPPMAPATVKTRAKPNPDIFLAAARSLGYNVGTGEEPANEEERLERAKGLVFEDAVPGVQAGLRAGMNVCWIPDAELTKIYPGQDMGAHQVLNSMKEFDMTVWGM